MKSWDIDGVADALLLPDGLGDARLEVDLRRAFQRDRQRGRRLIPRALIEAQSSGSIAREKVGDRVFPGLFARAYSLRGVADAIFGQVVSLDDSGKVTHVGVRLLLDDSSEHLQFSPTVGWDIQMSLMSKLGWYGFSRAFSSGGASQTVTREFEIRDERWDALSADERESLVRRAEKLASEWQLISLESDSEFTLRLRRVVNNDRERFTHVHEKVMRPTI